MFRHVYSVLFLLVAACWVCDPACAGNIVPTNRFDLFVPGKMLITANINDREFKYVVDCFKSPILLGAKGVLVAFAQAYCGKEEDYGCGIVSKYVLTEGTDWVKKVTDKCGCEWKTQLNFKPRMKDYPSDPEKPIAVTKGDNIYLLSVLRKKAAVGVDWDFELTVGTMKYTEEAQGKLDTIKWHTSDSEFSEAKVELGSPLNGVVPKRGSAILMSNGAMVFVMSATRRSKEEILTLMWNGPGNAVVWNVCPVSESSGFEAPSLFEWEGKLIMNIHYQDGSHRLKESSDLGKRWSDAVALSRLKEPLKNKHDILPLTIGNVQVLIYTGVEKTVQDGKVVNRFSLWVADTVNVKRIGTISKDATQDLTSGGLVHVKGELFNVYQKLSCSSSFVFVSLKKQLEKIKAILKDPGADGSCISSPH